MSWPHAPVHKLEGAEAFMITAGPPRKEHLFCRPAHLDLFQSKLFECALVYGWNLQAWSIFSNHYHLVLTAGNCPGRLDDFIQDLYSRTARAMNELDNTPGRQVIFEYWDTRLTFQKSYMARLNYTHHNPVRHGLVRMARDYPWCSAGWFERTAENAFYKTVTSFPTNIVNVRDDYLPLTIENS